MVTSTSSSVSSLDSRNRMISFRLSVEEYEKFRELCFASGIRSLSEMARVAINNFLNQPPQAAAQNSLDARVSDLEARLRFLALEVKGLHEKRHNDQ
jgi:hypothetical protein